MSKHPFFLFALLIPVTARARTQFPTRHDCQRVYPTEAGFVPGALDEAA